MIVYRITKHKFPNPLDASGSKLRGGRYNLPDIGVVYCAQTESLARLEVLTDVISSGQISRLLSAIKIPDNLVLDYRNAGLADLNFPSNWSDIPPSSESREYGTQWVKSNKSVGLLVPSVQSSTELTVLLNPLHPSFDLVQIVKSQEVTFDRRYLVGG